MAAVRLSLVALTVQRIVNFLFLRRLVINFRTIRTGLLSSTSSCICISVLRSPLSGRDQSSILNLFSSECRSRASWLVGAGNDVVPQAVLRSFSSLCKLKNFLPLHWCQTRDWPCGVITLLPREISVFESVICPIFLCFDFVACTFFCPYLRFPLQIFKINTINKSIHTLSCRILHRCPKRLLGQTPIVPFL